jgi:hypothetical protein
MFLNISVDDRVSLQQHGDFTRFKLVIEGGPKSLDRIRLAMSTLAEIADLENSWVFEMQLRQMPEVLHDPAWQRSFDSMISSARPHGWVDDTRRAIKAHIEWAHAAPV